MLSSNPSRQQGMTLLESLVSIAILAVAVLGMLGVQLRLLAETQTGVRRGQAVRLIEDFSERIKTNPGGYSQLGAYVSDFTATVPQPTVNCSTTDCLPEELALWDLAKWKTNVAQILPLGQANLFLSTDEATSSNRRQLGIIVAWKKNEASDSDDYKTPFLPSAVVKGIECPATHLCHLVYVQP